jgi:hypothetical protein
MAITETILIMKSIFERLDVEHKEMTRNIPIDEM